MTAIHPRQIAFLEGGKYHPFYDYEPGADLKRQACSFTCPRCRSAEIVVEALRVHVRAGHPKEPTVDGIVKCPRPACGWRVRIERGLCVELDTEAWLTDPTKARSGKPIVFPPIAHLREQHEAQGFGR